MKDDYISRQAAIEVREKVHQVFRDLNLSCAYGLPSFWVNKGKDYVVIPTKFSKGYQKALEDAEKAIVEELEDYVPSAQPEPITVNIDHELTQEEYEKLRKDMANAPVMLLPPAQQWIPCNERLPKIGKQVLCCDSQSRVFTSALTEIASNGMTFFGQHCKVIAWMPLPEPYKDGEL